MPKVMPERYNTSTNICYTRMTESPSSAVPSKSTRRRGRPRGNPRPLSEEEKKQRNAQYERERRNEAAEAMIELQAAVGLEGRVSNNEVIKTALHRIGNYNRNPPEDLDDIRRQNQALADQIAKLERIIAGSLDEEEDDEDSIDNDSVAEDSVEENSVDDNDSANDAIEEQEHEVVDEYGEQTLQDTYAAYCHANHSYYDNEYCRDAQLPNVLGMD